MTATITPSTTTAGPEFTVPLAELTEALDALALAVPARPAVPVLGGVRIWQDPSGVRLSTFDYETSVSVQLEGQGVAGSRVAVVNLAELRKVVKAATKGETARTTAGWSVKLTSRSWAANESDAEVAVAGFTVPVTTLPADQYPNLPARSDATFSLDRDVLLDRLQRTVVAAGKDDTLPMLTGVRVELARGVLTFAASDRFRLAVTSTPVDSDAKGGWLVSGRELVALVKAMPAGPVSVGVTDTTWTLRGGPITATRRLLDAEFPKWRQLLVSDHETTASVDRAALVKSVSKVLAISAALADASGYVQLQAEGGHLTVSPHFSDATQQGRVRGHALDATVDGPAMVIGATGKYLLEALQSLTGDTVVFGLATPTRPLLMADSAAELHNDNAGHRHLLMPVRLNV